MACKNEKNAESEKAPSDGSAKTVTGESVRLLVGGIEVERQPGRVIYSWSRCWGWKTDIFMMFELLVFSFLMDRFSTVKPLKNSFADLYPYATFFIPLAVFSISIPLIGYLWHRRARNRNRLEISSDGIHFSRETFGKVKRSKSVRCEDVRDIRAMPSVSNCGVYIMGSGHFGGIMTGRLASRQDEEWLAGAVEADLEALGYEL